MRKWEKQTILIFKRENYKHNLNVKALITALSAWFLTTIDFQKVTNKQYMKNNLGKSNRKYMKKKLIGLGQIVS